MRYLVVLLLAVPVLARGAPADYFAIHLIDDQTGRGIPLVYLTTTYHATYLTDSSGYIAFLEPGLMAGTDVWFDVKSYGYQSPVGPFGVEGVKLNPAPGKSAEIKLHRTQIAERLYRLTGYGIYRDSVLLGRPTPIRQPLLNARVAGQDTIQTAIYHGKMYWLWGDTDQIGFGLGGFSMTGGTSALPAQLDPDRGIDFNYFVDKPGEFARGMTHVPRQQNNPIWLDGLTVVNDKTGRERMIGRYVAPDAAMKPLEVGLLVYNDEKNVFERLRQFPDAGQGVLAPTGHFICVRDGAENYVLYHNNVRVRADFESASDPKNYQAFTCLRPDGTAARDNDGKLVWQWRNDAAALDFDAAERLVTAGRIRREESPFDLIDLETGKPIVAASGSVAWNPYLKRWTLLFGQKQGSSVVGEIWLATADSPVGPWHGARKVATHAMPKNDNDCYNPIEHDELQRDGGRFVYFSGTFVNTFSGNPWPTPYYDYNNLMYRIDLADPRLTFPPPPPGLVKFDPAQATSQPTK